MRPADDLIERYDRHASVYRELWAPVLRTAGVRLVHELAGCRAEWVVDVGAGVGLLLADLKAAFPAASVFGVDRSRGMLALAPPEMARAVMDATRLGLRAESIDVAVMAFVLFHLEPPLAGLLEARRVLRTGGRFGSATWGGDLESAAGRLWNECLDTHGATPLDPANQTRHEAVDTPEKVEALLREAGFVSVRAWSEDLVQRFELERLLRLKTGMGSTKPRFDSLAPEGQAACVAAARRRMEALAPEDFVARGRVVYAVASA